MDCRPAGIGGIRSETHLFSLSGLIAGACLAFIWYTPEPNSTSIPEVVIPLGISLGLGLYSLRLKLRQNSAHRSKQLAKYAWIGALSSGSIGGVWMALHLSLGLPIDVLPDKLLTVLSMGIAVGVLVGQRSTVDQPVAWSTDRCRIVAERGWTTFSEPTPIFDAILDILEESTEIDALDLDPLYHQMDPDVLSELRSQDGSPWQLTFYVDEYEIRVSSHGAVTVYRVDQRSEPSPAIRPH